MEFAIFLFDKEEGGHLERVGRSDFSSDEVFFEKVLSGFLLVWREGVDFANLWHKGVVKIDFMIIKMGGGNMVCCFLRKDLGIVNVL